MENLEKRACQIIQSGSVLDLKHNRFKVPSQSETDKYYDVSFLDSWKCTCAYHINGHGDCKHIIAVQIILSKINETEPEPEPVEIEIPDPMCPKCNSDNCVFYETRAGKHTESTRYRCKACGNRFTYRPGFLGKHFADHIITDALEDVAAGKSGNATARGIEKRVKSGTKTKDSDTQHAPHPATIWRWGKDATIKTANLCKHILVQAGTHWSINEIFFKTKKEGKWFFFKVVDMKSRFILATDVSNDKLGYDATDLFQDAIDTVGKPCNVLVSDKLNGFAKGFKNTMGKGATHIRSACVRKHHIHNNGHESQNGTMRNRIKTARGFGTENPHLLNLYVLYHNFIRPHIGLGGRTPADALGIHIRGSDKWKTILAYAATCC